MRWTPRPPAIDLGLDEPLYCEFCPSNGGPCCVCGGGPVIRDNPLLDSVMLDRKAGAA